MYRRRFPVADMAPSPRATTGKELLGISEPLLSMRATAMRWRDDSEERRSSP
jgi:hypothetical protein